MGSVKDLIIDDSPAGRIYRPPKVDEFGEGAWNVKGTYSVKDLKELIPPIEIPNKAEALAMTNGSFFEHLSNTHPDIEHCYLGMFDNERGEVVSVQDLLDRGETSNVVVMKLAHTPESFTEGNLGRYRGDLLTGTLQCGVADVESIFRQGFPLGSSTFKKIFRAAGPEMATKYQGLATYDEVTSGLEQIRASVDGEGWERFPELEQLLKDYGLGKEIPNPGFLLDKIVFDSTTKFERAGDREITREEERMFSGLNDEGYNAWTTNIFPRFAKAQIDFATQKDLLNYDGKGECVTYKGYPVITDFACTPDENRLTILYKDPSNAGVMLAIPTNKEFKRARFTAAGVDTAIHHARMQAEKEQGSDESWRDYMGGVMKDMKLDLQAVSEDCLEVMSYAIAEVANRILGQRVFDIPRLETWVDQMIPYASRVERKAS